MILPNDLGNRKLKKKLVEQGYMDDFRAYPKALTEKEVKEDYSKEKKA